MWEQYKKTFWGVQALIAIVTATVFFKGHHAWQPSALIFFTMQASAFTGASWASRLKRKMQAARST